MCGLSRQRNTGKIFVAGVTGIVNEFTEHPIEKKKNRKRNEQQSGTCKWYRERASHDEIDSCNERQ